MGSAFLCIAVWRLDYTSKNTKNPYCHYDNTGTALVETMGLEPMTSCVWSRRSNQLSYASKNDVNKLLVYIIIKK